MLKNLTLGQIQGSFILMILSMLLGQDLHAYEIVSRVKLIHADFMEIDSSLIHKMLRRMTDDGLLRSYDVKVGPKRKRTYYKLIESGYDHLFDALADFKTLVDITLAVVTNEVEKHDV